MQDFCSLSLNKIRRASQKAEAPSPPASFLSQKRMTPFDTFGEQHVLVCMVLSLQFCECYSKGIILDVFLYTNLHIFKSKLLMVLQYRFQVSYISTNHNSVNIH